MKPILMAGTTIVILALISYTIGTITLQRSRLISGKVTFFLTLGVILDIVATACMISGSDKGWFTIHGLLGYSSLTGMLIDVILIWRQKMADASRTTPRWLHIYSRIAYSWWVLAFISGSVLVAMRKMGS